MRSGDSIRGNQDGNRATGNQRIGLAAGMACIRDHADRSRTFSISRLA